jgi:thymidylate kinase
MIDRAGYFVVIEGPTGVGKTTVTGLLHAELIGRGVPTWLRRSPPTLLSSLVLHRLDGVDQVFLTRSISTRTNLTSSSS